MGFEKGLAVVAEAVTDVGTDWIVGVAGVFADFEASVEAFVVVAVVAAVVAQKPNYGDVVLGGVVAEAAAESVVGYEQDFADADGAFADAVVASGTVAVVGLESRTSDCCNSCHRIQSIVAAALWDCTVPPVVVHLPPEPFDERNHPSSQELH